MNAGDLLIFNSLLAWHSANRSENKVRIAQYISMMPAQEENETLRSGGSIHGGDRIAPEGYAFRVIEEWEKTKYGQRN
jgi:ectoine hydroxylase-related dioxygenase (phytanoyl-CoA dioxygenase family)